MPGTAKNVRKKSQPELEALFLSIAPRTADVTQRKMFGYTCCFVNGNLFAGMYQHNLILRLAPAVRQQLLEQPGASVFEPMTGRAMKHTVCLADPLSADVKTLKRWMMKALAHASALPVKMPKTKKTVK